MNGHKSLGAVFALILVASVPHAQAAYAYAPLAVVAGHATIDGESVAFVAWTRGSEAADEYRIYGINGTTFELLEVETGTATPVPEGYAAYAVTGVVLGIESDPVYATIVPCVDIDPTPPPPNYAIGECISGVGIHS